MSGGPGEYGMLGGSELTPPEKKERAVVMPDNYFVVIGFEVNQPKAFVDDTLYLTTDTGHAFYYLVRNLEVVTSLSFGPADRGKDKKPVLGPRPGTPDYDIKEPVKAFRMFLSEKRAKKLQAVTQTIRSDIERGSEKYRINMNDTCAETARDALESAGVVTPPGQSWVKYAKDHWFKAWAVNPYKWHRNLKSICEEVSYPTGSTGFLLQVGGPDPIFGPE